MQLSYVDIGGEHESVTKLLRTGLSGAAVGCFANAVLFSCLLAGCHGSEPPSGQARSVQANSREFSGFGPSEQQAANTERMGFESRVHGAATPPAHYPQSGTQAAVAPTEQPYVHPQHAGPAGVPVSVSSEELRSQALYAAESDRRLTAVHAISNQRSTNAAETLAQAALDHEPEVRYHAILALRRLVADGLDPDGQIRATLSAAAADRDPSVAQLATEVLGDLNK